MPWWPSCLSDQIAFSNSECDVVWRVSRLLPCPSSWILYLNDSAILNLHFTPMPPIKFRLNLTFEEISRWPPWQALWISEWNDFNNFEFLCHCDASYQVSAQSDLRDVVWRISRWLPWRPSWISERNDFSNFESLCHCDAFHQGLRGDVVWRISRGPPWRQSWISEWNNFSNFESLCHWDASHQVSAQSDRVWERRCHLKDFRMAAVAAILDIGMEQF